MKFAVKAVFIAKLLQIQIRLVVIELILQIDDPLVQLDHPVEHLAELHQHHGNVQISLLDSSHSDALYCIIEKMRIDLRLQRVKLRRFPCDLCLILHFDLLIEPLTHLVELRSEHGQLVMVANGDRSLGKRGGIALHRRGKIVKPAAIAVIAKKDDRHDQQHGRQQDPDQKPNHVHRCRMERVERHNADKLDPGGTDRAGRDLGVFLQSRVKTGSEELVRSGKEDRIFPVERIHIAAGQRAQLSVGIGKDRQRVIDQHDADKIFLKYAVRIKDFDRKRNEFCISRDEIVLHGGICNADALVGMDQLLYHGERIIRKRNPHAPRRAGGSKEDIGAFDRNDDCVQNVFVRIAYSRQIAVEKADVLQRE